MIFRRPDIDIFVSRTSQPSVPATSPTTTHRHQAPQVRSRSTDSRLVVAVSLRYCASTFVRIATENVAPHGTQDTVLLTRCRQQAEALSSPCDVIPTSRLHHF